MNGLNAIYLPHGQEFVLGYQRYNQNEPRASIWFEAKGIVQTSWGDAQRMSDGVRLIIRGWNRFYAGYDTGALIATINACLTVLSVFRDRQIESYVEDDNEALLGLFESFQDALRRTRDSRRSPVSVGKALSLFAPGYFPIWDSNIAFAYGCPYVYDGTAQYVAFVGHMKRLADHVRSNVPQTDDRPLLKRIDEYNYSKYTKHWV